MVRPMFVAALLVVLVLTTPAICFESCADDDASGCPHAQMAIATEIPDAVSLIGVRRVPLSNARAFTSPLVSDVFHVPLLG